MNDHNAVCFFCLFFFACFWCSSEVKRPWPPPLCFLLGKRKKTMSWQISVCDSCANKTGATLKRRRKSHRQAETNVGFSLFTSPLANWWPSLIPLTRVLNDLPLNKESHTLTFTLTNVIMSLMDPLHGWLTAGSTDIMNLHATTAATCVAPS